MAEEENQRINYIKNIREYLKLVSRNKFLFIIAILLTVFTQSFSVINNLLFKAVVDNGTTFSAGVMTQAQFVSAASIIILSFAVVFITWAILEWVKLHITNRIEAGLSLDIKQKYFARILDLDYEFHTSHKTGTTISRLIRASGAAENFTDNIIYNSSPLLVQLLILLPLLFQIAPIYSLILASVCFLFLGYTIFISRYFGIYRDKENQALDIEKGRISDVFTNIDAVKYFGKNRMVSRDFNAITENTRRASLKSWGWWRWLLSGYQIIIGIGAVSLLYFSLTQFAAGEITLGTLTFLYTTYLSILGPLYGFSFGIRSAATSIADMQDLFEYKYVERKVKDEPGAKPIKISKGEIEFQNVYFGFENETLFEDFSLKVKGGKTFALVGHSGSGKSTLVKLLYRLYDVRSGAILIDGQDIRSVTQDSLREGMSVVPQEVILFDDTIYNNIRFSNMEASRKEVMDAIRFANLAAFVEKLPRKEKTIVGERGVKLSGGERQRVAIARAILANKKILVLDEATSSLDSATENQIQRCLSYLMKGRTTIVIAHRLSTIMNADEIIVMKEGKIVQRGTHNELIRKGGEYKRLWDLQKGGYIP